MKQQPSHSRNTLRTETTNNTQTHNQQIKQIMRTHMINNKTYTHTHTLQTQTNNTPNTHNLNTTTVANTTHDT